MSTPSPIQTEHDDKPTSPDASNTNDGKKSEAFVTETTTNSSSSGLHAHFDCFSGAAGDMMLAACLDASDDPQKMLDYVQTSLEYGIPELKGEFQLSFERVWRGMGRIAACKVNVESVYGHKPAPVPGAPATKEGKEHHDPHHDNSNNDIDGNNKHDHSHHHHDENDDNNEHDHTHDHVHSHSHDHNNHEKKEDGNEKSQTNTTEEKSLDHSHSHGHGHDHIHSHSHSHDHGHTHSHGHDHGHSHNHDSGPLRNLPQIRTLLENASTKHIPTSVSKLAIKAFTELAIAESRTHGVTSSINDVHFHEVGAIDSIVDTVGTVLALHKLNVKTVSCSRLPLGEGTVWTDHGLLPVPAPAALRLMIGMPTCPGPKGLTGELVTPTGAALMRALTGVADGVILTGRAPPFTPRVVGIGAGTKDFVKHPNVLRLILGDSVTKDNRVTPKMTTVATTSATDSSTSAMDKDTTGEKESNQVAKLENSKKSQSISNSLTKTVEKDSAGDRSRNNNKKRKWKMDRMSHLEANIDDATPELLAHIVNLMLSNGAVDAWIHPIVMKKGRSAHTLHCLCRKDGEVKDDNENSDNGGDGSVTTKLLELLFRHTTTLGIRIQRNVERAALHRSFRKVQLPFVDNDRGGKVDVKLGILRSESENEEKQGEVVSIKAEFDHCRVISEQSSVPLKQVKEMAERSVNEQLFPLTLRK